jgi:hypothetical protein
MCTSDENFCKDTFCELKPIGPNKVLFSAGSNFLKPQKNVYVNFPATVNEIFLEIFQIFEIVFFRIFKILAFSFIFKRENYTALITDQIFRKFMRDFIENPRDHF